MDREAFRKYLKFIWFVEDEGMDKPSLKYRIKTWMKILFVPNSVAQWLRKIRAERKGPFKPINALSKEKIDDMNKQFKEGLLKDALKAYPETTESDWKFRTIGVIDEDIDVSELMN